MGEHRTLYLWLKPKQIAQHRLEEGPGESIMKRRDFLTKGTVAAGLASSNLFATGGGALAFTIRVPTALHAFF